MSLFENESFVFVLCHTPDCVNASDREVMLWPLKGSKHRSVREQFDDVCFDHVNNTRERACVCERVCVCVYGCVLRVCVSMFRNVLCFPH